MPISGIDVNGTVGWPDAPILQIMATKAFDPADSGIGSNPRSEDPQQMSDERARLRTSLMLSQ
jgi:hypothetical protein